MTSDASERGGERGPLPSRDEAARGQVLEMGERGEPGGADEPGIEADIDLLDDLGNRRRPGLEARENRRLALAPMAQQCAHVPARVPHRPGVTWRRSVRRVMLIRVMTFPRATVGLSHPRPICSRHLATPARTGAP